MPTTKRSAKKNLEFDVAIVGGGITGVISAYLLSKIGKKVILLEENTLARGATKDTTAFITQIIDTSLSDLIAIHGVADTRIIMESHAKAIDLIERIIKDEKLDCGFMRCSNFEYANSESELEYLKKEHIAAKKLDLAVARRDAGSVRGFKNAGALEFKRQAKFSAVRFVQGLAPILRRNGVVIHEHTKVQDVIANEEGARVKARGMMIFTDWAIIATYEPLDKPLALYFKKAFYTTYVLEAEIPKGSIREGIYEDTMDPYHYFRIDAGGKKDTLIIGGEDHRSDIRVKKSKNMNSLKRYLDGIAQFPYTIKSEWDGQILESVDGLPFIGPMNDDHLMYALAFSGNGMTYSAIAAQVFSDIITGTRNRWLPVYYAGRIPKLKSLIVKGRDYAQELIGGAIKNSLKNG